MHEPSKPAIRPSTHLTQRSLIVASDAVWPPVSGGDLRNWQNANALAALGEVLVTSVREPDGVIAIDNPRIRAVALATATENASTPRLAKRRTPLDTRIPTVALKRLLDEIAEFKPDTIVVEGIPLFALMAHVRPLVRRLVIDMHNVESDLMQQMLPEMGWLARRFSKKGRNVRRLREMELKSLRMADKVWVCSEQDRQRLLELSGGKTFADVIPNGIPRFDLIPTKPGGEPPMPNGHPTLLFVGHLNYAPNIEAARRLATGILPKIRAELGGARLIIAGRSPNRSLYELGELPDVELIRDPEELGPLYRQAHLAVVPLISGGGTRLKILEAMAWGLPVVATHLAAEGLGLVDGTDIELVDSDNDIVTRALRLCEDDGLRLKRRLQARDTAARRFGPAAIEAAVKESLASQR